MPPDLAGVTNDVCTVSQALSLVRDGYEVQVDVWFCKSSGGQEGSLLCRSELAREKPEGAAGHLALRVIVHDLRRNAARSKLAPTAVRGYLRQLRVRATFESTSHRPHRVESTAERGRSQAPVKLWRFSRGPWEISARH